MKIKLLSAILMSIIFISMHIQSAEGERKPFDNVDQIKRILETGHWGEKRQAARDLGKMEGVGVQEKVDILIKALDDEIKNPTSNNYVRGTGYATVTESLKTHYMLGLEDIGAPVIPFLKEKLKISHGELKKRIQITLGHLGDQDVYSDMVDLLSYDNDGYIRSSAARALGDIGNKDAIPVLLKAIHDPFVVPSGSDVFFPGMDTSIIYPVRDNAASSLRQFGIKVHSFGHEHYVIDERFDNYLKQKELLEKAVKESKERQKYFEENKKKEGDVILIPSKKSSH
jgi:hypothetical protein